MTNDGSSVHELKVNRVMRKYGLEHLGDEMVSLWTSTGEDRLTLRELEAWFNKKVTAKAISKSEFEIDLVEPYAEQVYGVLRGDDDTVETDREVLKGELKQKGVKVDDLMEDFVSYQAVNTWLKKSKGAEPPEKDTSQEREAKMIARVRKLRSRCEKVGVDSIELLRKMGDVTTAPVDVDVRFTVTCKECKFPMPITEFISKGGCESCLANRQRTENSSESGQSSNPEPSSS